MEAVLWLARKKILNIVFLTSLLILGFFTLAISQPVANVRLFPDGVSLEPYVEFEVLTLKVSGPGAWYAEKDFSPGRALFFVLPTTAVDGSYVYELLAVSAVGKATSAPGESQATDPSGRTEPNAPRNIPQDSYLQNGTFCVFDGTIVTAAAIVEGGVVPEDHSIYDDLIVTGSICVGFDCTDSYSFGFDTLALAENNLRIYFNDTSTGTFPTNDWRIAVNDTTSGGASYFAIQDVDSGRTPFRIEAGAPNHALYVEDYGRVGLGTSTPAVELHINDGDTSTVRLEQNSSSGWTAQTWDMAGNESNFFIRDVTNGSRLPFRIQPSAPSSSLSIRSDGKVGIGTWNPGSDFEIQRTGTSPTLAVNRTDGATGKITATLKKVKIGSQTSHPLALVVGGVTKVKINTDGSLTMANGASCTTGGVWTDASSRALKENIRQLNVQQAKEALEGLNPVQFTFKADSDEEHVGFIAEEVPGLVATKNRKGLSPMDIVGVLTMVVKEQQKTIDMLQERLASLEQQRAVENR